MTSVAIDLSARMDGLVLLVDSSTAELTGALDRATAALGAARDETADATAKLRATVEDALGELASLARNAPDALPGATAPHEMPDAFDQDAVSEAHAALAAAADECMHAREAHVGAAVELRLEGNALGAETADCEQTVGDGCEQVDHAIDAYRHDLLDGHAQDVGDSVTSAAARLTGPVRTELDKLFSELDAATDRALGALAQAAETHGSAWAGTVAAFVAETAQDITRDALRQVEAALIHVIQYAVELLFVEVTAQLVTLAMGAGITAALAPLIPELIMLKHALHALNWLLDLVS